MSSEISGKEAEEVAMAGRDWLWGSILVMAVVLAYLPVWHAGFIWDDDLLITANPCIVGPLGFKEIWTTTASASDIAPLTRSTYWLEHALWGVNPVPYHLVTVLMHGACAVLLWRVLTSLRVPGAWLGAALWALHPVMVESVAWVAEMRNTESGVFFLLSILFYLRWSKAKENQSGWNYGFTLLFAALAMMCKSSTVILPVVLCLCAWWMQGRWRWRNLFGVAPVVLMSLADSLLSIWTQKTQLASLADLQWVRSWPERLVTAGDAVWFYLGKLLWPHPLIAVYPRWDIDSTKFVSYLPLLAVFIILFILWFKRDSSARPWFFVFAFFLVALLPVLGLVENTIFRYSLVFDHFQYLASMGPLALVGAGMATFADYVMPGNLRLQANLCAVLLLVLGISSWQRSKVYENSETLWTDTLAKNPDCWVANQNLGSAFLHQGRTDEALVQFQKGLENNPNHAEACLNLGNALLQKGKWDDALVQFQAALEANPNYAEACVNLGNVMLRIGKVDEATVRYRQAVVMDPNYAMAHYNLGVALSRQGQAEAAMAEFQKALLLNPDYAEAHYSVGGVLLQKGQVDGAIAEYQRALEIDPGYAEAHFGLGSIHLQRREVSAAIVEFQQALAIKPDLAEAHNNLGLAVLVTGGVDEAIGEFEQALAINPAYAEAHTNLAIALAQKGRLDEALPHFQEAARLNPADKNAQANLARIQGMMKPGMQKGK